MPKQRDQETSVSASETARSKKPLRAAMSGSEDFGAGPSCEPRKELKPRQGW